MPNVSARVPGLCKHRATGQAVVRLNGRDFYLGSYGSSAAKVEYDRLINDWLAHGRQISRADTGLSFAELIVAYVRFAETYYVKDGVPTSETEVIRQAMKWLRKFHAKTPVSQFGPRAFKVVRQAIIDARISRATVNGYMNRIRRCFRWGVEQELVPPSVLHGLQAVAGLKRGRSEARETEPVKPVPQAFIDAILPHVSPQVAAMIEFQLLTGCRPGEACIVRSCDIDTTGRVWVYRPHDQDGASWAQAGDLYRPEGTARHQTLVANRTRCLPVSTGRGRRSAKHAATCKPRLADDTVSGRTKTPTERPASAPLPIRRRELPPCNCPRLRDRLRDAARIAKDQDSSRRFDRVEAIARSPRCRMASGTLLAPPPVAPQRGDEPPQGIWRRTRPDHPGAHHGVYN